MSDKFICVRSALVLACLIALSQCYPLTEQEPTLNRYDEKQGSELSTTESDGSHLPANTTEDTLVSSDEPNVTSKAEKIPSLFAVPLVGNEEPEKDDSKKENTKRSACRDRDNDRRHDHDHDHNDDDDDDDDDDEREERGKALLRSFEGVYERAKRADSEGESATQPESDFVDHVLDYSLNRKKREEDTETDTDGEMGDGDTSERKKRQSGETVPYITPNRSRRDEGSETVEEEGEQSGRRINEEGEGNEDMNEEEEDDDDDDDEEEEEEMEEDEDKKEEVIEKLAMES